MYRWGVTLQTCPLCESDFTNSAEKFSFPMYCWNMPGQKIYTWKSSITNGTFERFLSFMNCSFVPFQNVFTSKTLVTIVTFEKFFMQSFWHSCRILVRSAKPTVPGYDRSRYQDSTGELFRFLEQKLPNFWCYSKMYVPGCFSRFSHRLYPKPNII